MNQRSVLITGASGGMGKAAAVYFAKNGFRVFALDRKKCAAGENIVPIEADVTSAESLQNAFETVKAHTDSLFAIVHFAGIYMLDSLAEIAEENFCRAFDVNVFGVWRVNKTFLPLLSRGSRILVTTSELAPLDPLPFTGIYAVTKSALEKYALSLGMELQLLGISVSVLRPGAVKTDMLGVSTEALDRFCRETKLYAVHSRRFKKIVESVEAKNIPPEKIAKKAFGIVTAKKPSLVSSVNRNPLLLMLNCLPLGLQRKIIGMILK